jgi:hypothetical protein
VDLGALKIFRIKEPLFPVLEEKNQNERTVGYGYFSNIKEPAVFLKKPAKKNWLLERQVFEIFKKHDN